MEVFNSIKFQILSITQNALVRGIDNERNESAREESVSLRSSKNRTKQHKKLDGSTEN